ncbi:MAG: hypothetical protein HY757_02880 [Nitrospirae bacterium]|nr:hypothetical protein [Nitrospirota bacterium]
MKASDNLKIISSVLVCLVLFAVFYVKSVSAGPYLNSAHGSSSYGVKRSAADYESPAIDPNYIKGLCAHCHEQHASIDGFEPYPVPGPDNYTLFYSNYVNQTDGFCFQCHTSSSSHQATAFNNYNYSYRAGGDTSLTCPNNILSAFSFINESGAPVSNCSSSTGSSHKLTDIQTFITAAAQSSWGFTANSNPCSACHNPHSAQRDPHTSGSRGYPVSRPSLHNSKDNNSWGLWGDSAAELMNNYTASYQAPYRSGSTTLYEPDGSTTTNGSNLTDYVTFCTDCHNSTNTIYSTTLGRNLYQFNWSAEKHGGGAATNDASVTDIIAPYQEAQLGNYVLACTDCHEPHGSPNRYLIRKMVNGGATTVTVITTPDNTRDWNSLCTKCHNDSTSISNSHHILGMGCTTCHTPDPADFPNCLDCHYHGSTAIYGSPYNGGEHLF